MELPLWVDAFEQHGLSKWLRESRSLVIGYYPILLLHTLGLSLVVGPNAAINLRLLGVAGDIPVAPLRRWFSLIWFGLVLNVTSGVLLVYVYPVKSLTNPVFYIKLALLGFAIWILLRIKTRVFDDSGLNEADMVARGRMLAVWSLLAWMSVLWAGRLLAYTCHYLLYAVPC